jgi:hypothetical protein
MAELQGYAYWPGINQIVSCSYTAAHGITPSAAVLEIAPQFNNFQADGDLTFYYGSNVIVLRDCKVDTLSFERNENGEIWRLVILDRRWKWKFGKLSGMYNVRKENGDIKIAGARNTSLVYETEKSPQDLLKLCLEAANERRFDVSQVPNNTRPFVEWDVDCPMQAANQLCDELGCRIMLTSDDRVRICKQGQGQQLPNGPILDDSGTIDPPNTVQKITVACGKVLYQADLPLEPVGYEMDGTLKPINELSYTPVGGWGSIDLQTFNGIKDQELRELAQSCIFKTYRVRTPVTIPNYGTVNGLDALGLTNNQVVLVSDYDTNGRLLPDRLAKAIVWGDYYPEKGDHTNTGTTSLPQRITKEQQKKVIMSFNLDADERLVTFGNYIYKLNGTIPNMTVDPATIYLRCALNVREEKTRAWWRYGYGRGNGWPEQIIHKENELILSYRQDGNNRADIDRQANYYLDAEWNSLQTKQPQARTYAGLLKIELDGAIQQVTWSVGLGGATTKASRCDDMDTGVLSYDQKRFYEKTRNTNSKPAMTESVIKGLRGAI